MKNNTEEKLKRFIRVSVEKRKTQMKEEIADLLESMFPDCPTSNKKYDREKLEKLDCPIVSVLRMMDRVNEGMRSPFKGDILVNLAQAILWIYGYSCNQEKINHLAGRIDGYYHDQILEQMVESSFPGEDNELVKEVIIKGKNLEVTSE